MKPGLLQHKRLASALIKVYTCYLQEEELLEQTTQTSLPYAEAERVKVLAYIRVLQHMVLVNKFEI